jgi:ABC-type branched-subunit amino acid transport system ATPase component/predicted MFS family arabinose efflux permease
MATRGRLRATSPDDVSGALATLPSPTEEIEETTAAGDPAGLAAAVLEEEAKRQEEQAQRGRDEVILPDDLLPGVGGDEMPLKEVVKRGGKATIVVLFGLGMVDNLNNAAFSVLAPDIQRSLDLSDAAIGIIGALAGFTLFLAAIPLGALGDRYRRTTIAGISTAVWAVFAVLTGMVNAIWQMVGARIMTGMGQANEQPIQSSILADAYPPEGRGRIFAMHRGATPVGLLAGPALAGFIASLAGGDEGWRWSFIVLGIPAALLALAVLLFVPEPKRGKYEQQEVLGEEVAEMESASHVSVGAAFARLKKISSFYYLMAALGAFGMAVVSVPIYLNLILDEELGMSAAQRGVMGTIAAAGGVVGAAYGGRTADSLFRKSPERAMIFIGGALAALGVGFALQANAPNPVVYTIVGVVTYAILFAGLVPLSPIVAAIVPYRLRSMGFAMVGLYLSLVGGIGGALLLGMISEASSERTAITLVAPIAGLVGGALVVYASRFIRSDIARSVADLIEERDELQRMGAGGEIPILQVRNLDFSYGQVQVLFDVNVDVKEGEVLALLGTNGAGKSTLLRAISGIGLADRGVVRFRGRTITYADPGARVRQGIVQVPGGKAIFPSLTVRENLLAGAHTFIWEPERVAERIERVVELFPILGDRMDQPAGTLSGGEQQMLGIGQALLLDPQVLLIDELSLGLAPVVVQQLLEVVERLKGEGITMVIVEQSVNVALSIADRAVFMEKGQVRFEGPAQELLERDDLVRAVFLGGEGG